MKKSIFVSSLLAMAVVFLSGCTTHHHHYYDPNTQVTVPGAKVAPAPASNKVTEAANAVAKDKVTAPTATDLKSTGATERTMTMTSPANMSAKVEKSYDAVDYVVAQGNIKDGLPATDAKVLVEGTTAPPLPFVIEKVDTANRTVTILVPVLPQQIVEDKLSNPKWQISVSLSYATGPNDPWQLISAEKDEYYIVPSMTQSDGYIRATISLPNKGNGWFWPQIWGQDTVSENWLWINPKDQHCVYSATSKPSYGFFVNANTGKTRVVKTSTARP